MSEDNHKLLHTAMCLEMDNEIDDLRWFLSCARNRNLKKQRTFTLITKPPPKALPTTFLTLEQCLILHVQEALLLTDGKVAIAAKLLDIDDATIYRYKIKYNI